MLTRFLTITLILGSLTLLPGCAGEAPAEVSGTVLLDGTPLSDGEIIFEAADGLKTPVAGPIKEGKYTLKVPPGAKKVKINASRPTAKPDPVMGAAAKEQMIREEFNVKTTLTADIKPGKQEGVDFKVLSIPRSGS